MQKRRNKQVFFIALLGFFIVLGVFARGVVKQDHYLSLAEAKKRWGQTKFDPTKFRAGDAKTKASMTVSLIEGRIMVGKPISEIKSILGDFSGHFWNDNIPTYIIEEGWKADKDTWQLVFLPNHERKIKEIKIHKNCCD